MTFARANSKSLLRSSGPRIFWCAVLLLWGSSSACSRIFFENLSSIEQTEVRLEVQGKVAKTSTLFLGRVESITPVRGALERGLQVYRLRFKVERSWIGTAKPRAFVTLKILEPDSTCDFFPEVKESWVVWVKPYTLEMDYRSRAVDLEHWASATLPQVLEALTTQSEP